MVLRQNISIILIIFQLVEKTISLQEIVLSKSYMYTGLALIKTNKGKLQLALPQENYLENFAIYAYDESENGGFFIACPPRNSLTEQFQVAENLKQNKKLSEDSRLLIAEEYSLLDRARCDSVLLPSIEKLELEDENGNKRGQYCGNSEAQIYNVGYPNVQFITIYQICYSDTEDIGMLYTLHVIVTPNLFFKELWEFYEFNPKTSFRTSFDKRDISAKTSEGEYYGYQYVGIDDMPIKAWDRTTLFSINYTLISKNKDLLRGMIAVDNFIRLFNKETNKTLTLYSGSNQETKNVSPSHCVPFLCGRTQSTQIDSFWRIIIDEEFNAIIIVTQHTLVKCNDDTYICDKNRIMVKNYRKGGCTYTCSVNDELTAKLGVAPLKIAGNLALAFLQKISVKKMKSLKAKFIEIQRKKISICSFMRKKSFMLGLKEADADLAKTVHVLEQKDEHRW